MKVKTPLSMPQTSLLQHPHHEMIFVEGGTFQMGSEEKNAFSREKPVHEVKVSDFYMGKYPVTQGLWKAVMGSEQNPSYFKGDDRPVECVSWEDATDFIQRLKELTGKNYRLPTEAEWEYAARGGEYSNGYQYAGGDKLNEVGWYSENSYEETKAVGLKAPNALGLYDLSGNVWEWCLDRYSGDYYEQCQKQEVFQDPTGPEEGTSRVLRGGSWGSAPRSCRCSYRGNYYPQARSYDVGFRLVCSLQSVGLP